eukprot:TRINITY_DN61761_c0_g1_i1.p1 TRINITY_DN61761_c0_g1~~TRINITY_DN61761_c0_g1_i1.p1  ORF type:complete len:581 (-),score=163.32 TRINITY_DN61761_c0_g1_i1:72-1814(-)
MALTPGNTGMSPKRQLNPIPPPAATPLERDVAQAAWEENVNRRERAKVEARGAERLQIAEERYKSFRAEQQAKRDRALELLQKDISNAQAHLWKTQLQTESTVNDLEAQRQDARVQEEAFRTARQQAHQKVNDIRESAATHSQWAFDEIGKVQASMEEEISAIHADALATVQDHRKQAAEHKAKTASDVAVRQSDANTFVKDTLARTQEGVLRHETQRHRAAAQIERIGELHQATRTQVQNAMRLQDEKSKNQTKELQSLAYQVQQRTDKALAEKMANISNELAEAKEFCYKMKIDLAEDSRLTKLALADMEQKAAHETREAHRKLRQLQNTVLDGFNTCQRTAQQAQETIQASRVACGQELEALERQFQTVNDETRDRVKAILAQWAADRDYTDEAIRRSEKQRKEALDEVTSSMSRAQRVYETKGQHLRETCLSNVEDMKRQEAQARSTAQQVSEARKVPDDQATEAALAEMQKLKEEIEAMQAQADHAVEGFQMKAAEEEQQLLQEAEVHVDTCKQAAKQALEDEKVYSKETSEAWARIRKVSYHLRLANLHDFANGIVNGHFDNELALQDDTRAIC